MDRFTSAIVAIGALAMPLAVHAQPASSHLEVEEAQRSAMAPIDWLDGAWRGQATMTFPNGQSHSFTQTERVGGMLNGSVKVIEGRGYASDGELVFNAFAILSFDPKSGKYSMRSYARGHAGDFPAEVQGERLIWKIPSGSATSVYTLWMDEEGRWRETGAREIADRDPIVFFEMTLEKVGPASWPSANPVGQND